jgi:hypothetical protein
MYLTCFRRCCFTTFLLASVCLFLCAGKSQDALPTTVARSPWHDPHVSKRYKKWLKEDSSSTQYQLVRSPRSNPIVSFCGEKFLIRFVAAVLAFFIAGLL